MFYLTFVTDLRIAQRSGITKLHRDVTDAGKQILMEKPFAMTGEDGCVAHL